jgi:ubiquinone/menaquinone biosynthesis C-methylase UbiE
MEDWPQALFVEKADLYRLQLEERLQRVEEEAELLVKLFQAQGILTGAKTLGVCCGIGRHSVALAKRGYHAVGVDFSPKLSGARSLAGQGS